MIPTIERILFATDLSENSTPAGLRAAGLARATGARVHLLHVQEPLSEDARVTLELFMLSEHGRDDALRRRREMVEGVLAERQERFWETLGDAAGALRDQLEAIEVVEGYPAETILRRAHELGVDLVVLGAHNHGLTQTFLGSVAKRVLRRSDIPTLVVPYSDPGTRPR